MPLLEARAAESLTVTNSGWSTPLSFNASPSVTTLLQLLTNPLPYDQRRIRVTGVLSVEFEDNRLYFSKEFFEAFYPQYAIDLRLPSGAVKASNRFQGKYVAVEGTFRVDSASRNHGIMEVTSLEMAEQPRNVRAR